MVVHKLAYSAARTLRANPLEHARNCAQTVTHTTPVHKGTWTGALEPARSCARMETHKRGHSTARTRRADSFVHARKCAQREIHKPLVHYTSLHSRGHAHSIRQASQPQELSHATRGWSYTDVCVCHSVSFCQTWAASVRRQIATEVAANLSQLAHNII